MSTWLFEGNRSYTLLSPPAYRSHRWWLSLLSLFIISSLLKLVPPSNSLRIILNFFCVCVPIVSGLDFDSMISSTIVTRKDTFEIRFWNLYLKFWECRNKCIFREIQDVSKPSHVVPLWHSNFYRWYPRMWKLQGCRKELAEVCSCYSNSSESLGFSWLYKAFMRENRV